MEYEILCLLFQIIRSDQNKTETFSVPYLNPLVLRKEFESILGMYVKLYETLHY